MVLPEPRRLSPYELHRLYLNSPGASELQRAMAFGNAIANYYLQPPTRGRIPLADLVLPQLTYGALRRAGYTYLDEIAELSDRHLSLIRGLGEKGIKLVRAVIVKHYPK